MLIYMMIAMPVLIALAAFFIAKSCWESHRFWSKMTANGRVGNWSEVQTKLSQGSGTLLVEVGMKGPEYSWWIEEPCGDVDPHRAVPSWRDYEQRGWNAASGDKSGFEAMNRWTVEKLGVYESSAKVVVVSQRALAGLNEDVKQGSVLAVLAWCDGCLSRRSA
jgi:hypothetical protein